MQDLKIAHDAKLCRHDQKHFDSQITINYKLHQWISKNCLPGAVLGKNIWGAWPLIIWEATTSRTTVSNCPVLSNLCTVITLKILRAGESLARFWGGLCPPGPNLEPPLLSTYTPLNYLQKHFDQLFIPDMYTVNHKERRLYSFRFPLIQEV